MAAHGSHGKNKAPWLEQLLDGDRVALARALSAIESEAGEAASVLRTIFPRLGRARVVGVTGAPGAGKSTLVNAYIAELRKRGTSVGVVAIDPSSPHSGGAILGDRIRMTQHSGDPGVFVRSLASRGHLGGLSRAASRAVDVMDAAGRDVVIVETVGAGQSEIEIAEIADTKIVITAPGLGDEVQALKAGILEIADILVVNKADLPDARRAAAQFEAMLDFRDSAKWRPTVLCVSSIRGEGIAELADAVVAHGRSIAPAAGIRANNAARRVQRLLSAIAAERVRGALHAAEDRKLAEVCEAVLKGEMSFEQGAERALELFHQLFAVASH
ncbi:MAG TPA: methylmalonyl Co-A mutase-associated GTPase MeaB [Alphaproteobacteria bacterium]|nr:methylmalonyl Co-A mutase-associated GTPase MeaB [Alphaproteobacteria bacterium]